MKVNLYTIGLLAFLGFSTTVNAQFQSNLTSSNRPQGHEERMKDLHEARVDVLVKNLGLSGDQEQQFRAIYNDYEESQMNIMKEFKSKFDNRNATDGEAKERIYIGFDVSQRLLNNRKQFADKFLKVISPLQLEKMYEMEKRMGKRIMEKRTQEEGK